jgi:effector-binding domain-containing protein
MAGDGLTGCPSEARWSVRVLPSRPVAYEVRTEWAEPRRLAAIHTVTTQQRLSTDIPRLVGKIWPVLRDQNARTGHNVVIYRGNPAALTIDAGVEVFTEFTGHGEIQPVSTPAGEVVTTAHFGDYAEMAAAYAALEQWWTDSGRRPAGVSWEVYGDWDDDPAKVRTDIYFLLRPASS